MAVYKLLLVFGVFIHSAISSPISDVITDLIDSLKHFKNETDHVKVSNDKLTLEIKEQSDRFESDFLKLTAVEESENEELKNVTENLKDHQLKLKFLYVARDILVNISIPEETYKVARAEYGLKWLGEDLALLQKRSSNGDQLACFRILEEHSQRDNGTIKVLQRKLVQRKMFNPYDDAVEVLKLDLGQAVTAFKKAQRTNNQLLLTLSTERAAFVEIHNNMKANIEDVAEDVERAKAILAKFEDALAVVSKEVEELEKEYDDLVKKEEAFRAEAVEVKRDLNSYKKAAECYDKYARFVTGDEDLFTSNLIR